jgi:hypothetical protein
METIGCYFLKEDSSLWLAISYRDEYDFVTTSFYFIAEAPQSE